MELLSHCSKTVHEHLNLLTDYVFGNYGHEYMAADTSFLRGKVTVDLFKYLIQPTVDTSLIFGDDFSDLDPA